MIERAILLVSAPLSRRYVVGIIQDMSGNCIIVKLVDTIARKIFWKQRLRLIPERFSFSSSVNIPRELCGLLEL